MFCQIHCGIGDFYQLRCRFSVVGVEGDADADAYRAFFSIQNKRASNGFDNFISHMLYVVRCSHVAEDHRKLIATHARHCVRFTYTPNDSFGCLAQKHIANIVPERIIDELKAVEIEKKDGAQLFLSSSPCYCLVEAIIKQDAVWECCKGVVVSEIGNLFICLFEARK